MKKALLVMAVLIAVVASTTIGGAQTASAFNPQPEPPALMPGNVQAWYQSIIVIDDNGARSVNPVGDLPTAFAVLIPAVEPVR